MAMGLVGDADKSQIQTGSFQRNSLLDWAASLTFNTVVKLAATPVNPSRIFKKSRRLTLELVQWGCINDHSNSSIDSAVYCIVIGGISHLRMGSGCKGNVILKRLQHRKINQHRGWRVLGILLALSLSSHSTAWSKTLSLPALVEHTMQFYFERPSSKTMETSIVAGPSSSSAYAQFLQHLPSVATPYHRPAGVFVTLSRNGATRACWGSVFPQQKTVTEATVAATLGALTKEYRYRPIRPNEWQNLKPQVTVVTALEPIHSLQGQNPLLDGLMIRQGGRTGVILPGEARDATYQLVRCKLKAGIQPGQQFQLYRIKADVYH